MIKLDEYERYLKSQAKQIDKAEEAFFEECITQLYFLNRCGFDIEKIEDMLKESVNQAIDQFLEADHKGIFDD